MDLQNVSSLVIPEGEVRTIHDEESRLLWGRLNYNTRYMGNAIQDGTPTPDNPVNVQVVTGEQTVTVTGKNLLNNYDLDYVATNGEPSRITLTSIPTGIRFSYSAGANPFVVFRVMDLRGYEGAVIRMSCVFDNTATGYRLVLMDETGTNRATAANTIVSGEVISFTVPNDLADKPFLGYMLRKPGNSTSDFTNLIITINEPNMAYEIYQSHSYSVNLGTIELAKIGDYQDYIYKSGNDWYVHKETGGVTYTGGASENWDLYSSGTSVFRIRILDMKGQDNQQRIAPMFCNYYIPIAYGEIINPSYWPDYGIAGRVTSSSGIAIRNKDCADVTSFKTWLSTHNTSVYYVLATPTDTKITDSTLISQLDAIHQFLTRYGYNATVSGNLPMIINKTNL